MFDGSGVEPEASGPIAADPHLVGVEQLRDVVVLHPSEVPDEPPDSVGPGFGASREQGDIGRVDGRSSKQRDATEQLGEE